MYRSNINTDTPINFFLRNNCLYYTSKNNTVHKLASYVYCYCYIVDDVSNVHICYIDFKNKLNYYLYENNNWNKKILCKILTNKKNIYDIKLYIVKNTLNVFLIEYNNITFYKINHIHYDLSNNSYSNTVFNKEYYTNFSLYMIDSNNRYIILYLKYNFRNIPYEHSFIFDIEYKSWSKYSNINFNNKLIEYCRSLKYIDIN